MLHLGFKPLTELFREAFDQEAGTSDGVRKSWITRKGGEPAEPAPHLTKNQARGMKALSPRKPHDVKSLTAKVADIQQDIAKASTPEDLKMHTDRLDFYKGMLDKAKSHKQTHESKAVGDTGWGKVWFTTWMSAYGHSQVEPKEATETVAVEASDMDGHEAATSLLVQNPDINAATFLNLLKSKGFVINAPKVVDPEPKQKQADSASAHTAALRKQESAKLRSVCNFRESSYTDNGIGATKFHVVLIKEGMGNLRDAFYYPKSALKQAVPMFEGKKCYANHPSLSDEQNRPERDVREIIGHFENVGYQESDDGQGMIVADCLLMPDKDYEWARGLFRETVEYSKKYPDKDLVGLSINANGDANEVPLEEFVKESDVPDSCMRKLAKAKEQGIDRLRVVSKITDAVSCDLVTEAGAGGKIVKLIEGDMK